MKINWKARFKNKVFLVSFISLLITFVYQLLGILDIVPSVSEENIVNGFTIVINILAAVGVVVDPTTAGINDSDRAMLYFTDYDERLVD